MAPAKDMSTLVDEAERVDIDRDGDEDEDEVAQTGAPHTLQERRRAQKAVFEHWLTSDAAQETMMRQSMGETDEDADEKLSIHSLMAKQEGAQIVKNPREYQLELFERAKKENTIAVLDTGSGKTLIAVLLLRWIIDNELERRAAGKPSRISFFLVASVTLVFQQFAVLESNLDHKVARFCGGMGTDLWTKTLWEKEFATKQVIVCTADVLLQCLSHSYITIKQINLLIFDEAHHAKKNHSFARIIKDYYLDEPDEAARPRVFGMTASPIDSKSDVNQAAQELESLLHSKIATTMNASLTEVRNKISEQVLRYASLPEPFETDLIRNVRVSFGHMGELQKVLTTATNVAAHLGCWCADQYLIDALSERKLRKFEAAVERKYHARTGGRIVTELDDQIADLRKASAMVEERRAKCTSMQYGDLSAKVVELDRWLRYQFERPSSHRCLVFVDMRHTARLLSLVFQRIGSQNLRSDFLVGSDNPNMAEDKFSLRKQVLTLIKFRKGEVNCLFATSVAEEGLDVPDCNMVVRFDMYKTMIQYVQSRGRARQHNSKFIHMLEHGNSIQNQLMQESRYQEMTMRKFCQAMPEDRRLIGNEDSLEVIMARERGLPVHTDPATGAKLTYDNALVCLAHFVSAIPTETKELFHPTYAVQSHGSKFIAEVILPEFAPLRSAIGRICGKKILAKRSAAFEACLELRKKRLLDEHFMPTYQKKLPAMLNALLAVNMDETNTYPMKTKPSVWEQTRGSLPLELWVTVIDFPDGLERLHQPLALLTRTPMPRFPTFSIHLIDGRASRAVSCSLARALEVGDAQLEKLSAFTFRVFQDVFSKTYEQDAKKLSYWLAPALWEANDHDSLPSAVIDWDLLNEVHASDEYKWTPEMPNAFLSGRFLVDKWDGSRKFYSKSVVPALKPTDPPPDNVAKAKWNGSILEYSVSLYKQARAKAVWNMGQPVMEAEKIIARRNLLALPEQKEPNLRTLAFLCPEPLRISALPPAVVASCFVWPAIIHRLESYLIALEACAIVGVECEPEVALAAVTKDSDNSGEHENQERVNFQRGMGNNYERLEFIGDCFLKTATTMSTFIQNPNDNEFEFHVRRMLMLANLNLFNVAKKLKLYEHIRSQSFSRRLWYPEGLLLLEGKGAGKASAGREVVKHRLGEKTIADVCEAWIGAAFISHDKPGGWHPDQWQNAIHTVTKLVDKDDHRMQMWDDYRKAYEIPAYQTGEVTASQRDLAEKVELEHAYHFRYPRLLRSAFIHPSQPWLWEKLPSYQRLEFLGDALLDMASISYLFNRFSDKDPQWLTEHKMAMVSNKFLGAVCVNIGFHKHLRHNNSSLEHAIREYSTELLEAKRLAGDARDYWTTVSDPPKCLPDIIESYVGAIFIDSNFDYNEVQRFFDQHVRWYFEDMSVYDTFANNHPCTHLHHLLQTTYGCEDYRLMARELPAVDNVERQDIVVVVIIHNEVVAHSRGKSGRYARVRVANYALEKLNGLAPYEFRARFGCNCVLKREVAETDKQSGGGGGAAQAMPADCGI